MKSGLFSRSSRPPCRILFPPAARTEVFAWYTLAGSLATALGALCGGFVTQALQQTSMTPVASYRVVVLMYAALGMLLAFLFTRLSVLVEVGAVPGGSVSTAGIGNVFGITRSRNVVLKLSSLFALDSFAGGFVVQSFAAYWFYLRFGVRPATLGAIFFWANVFAGISALVASRLAGRIGLVRTMVFTHLPSNVLLILVPLMPNLSLAVLVLASAFQHQPDGRPGEAVLYHGGGSSRRTLRGRWISRESRGQPGRRLALCLRDFYSRGPRSSVVPFFIAGALKIVYDLMLYRGFVTIQPPEEQIAPQ